MDEVKVDAGTVQATVTPAPEETLVSPDTEVLTRDEAIEAGIDVDAAEANAVEVTEEEIDAAAAAATDVA